MKSIIIILSLFFLGCIERNIGDLSEEQLLNHKINVLKNGNKQSYGSLSIYYFCRPNYSDIIPYSMLMAEKYNDLDAHNHIYFELIRIFNNGKFNDSLINNLSDEYQKIAIYHLSKAGEMGDSRSKEIAEKYYSKHKK